MKARLFESGVVTVSLDTELGWARVNTGEYKDVVPRLKEGKKGIRKLLEVFDEYDIPATWAIVGRLIAPEEPTADVERLPTVADNIPWDRDWWRMPSLIEEIQMSSTNHEIGSHSGSHLLYGSLSPRQARDDIDTFKAFVGEETTDTVTSFVFPKNRIGNRPVLRQHGFTCYRGYPHRFSIAPIPTPFVPRRDDGLVNIPLSAEYRHFGDRHPVLRLSPTRLKVQGLKLGVRVAARTGRVFHVALHPNDFTLDDGESLLSGFETWLEYVDEMRQRGEIEVLTMGEVTNRVRWP